MLRFVVFAFEWRLGSGSSDTRSSFPVALTLPFPGCSSVPLRAYQPTGAYQRAVRGAGPLFKLIVRSALARARVKRHRRKRAAERERAAR